MTNNKNAKVLRGLNSIIQFLGKHGGIISIEDDWSFNCYRCDLGGKDFELLIYSSDDQEDDDEALTDPFFRIEVEFDDKEESITAARPIEYLSQWWGGEMRIDPDDNICDSQGNAEHNDGELMERLESYMDTVTEMYPYLRNPKSVIKFEEDIDCTYLNREPELKKMIKEAMARMRLLGASSEDVEKFGRGELTMVYVNHKERKVRKEEPTTEELEIINKAVEESSIPFLPYYITKDTITWEDGTVNTRYILSYVWDEKNDWNGVSDYEEGELWGKVRGRMIEYKMIPCYTINADIPEYSEFGELPFQMLNGTFFTVG